MTKSTKWWLTVVIIVIVIIVVSLILDSSTRERYVLRLENNSDYAIAPGVFVIHSYPEYTMNFLSTTAPKEYEKLAEVGDPTEVLEKLAQLDGIHAYGQTSAGPILSGEVVEIPIDPKLAQENPDARVSFMAMVVQTNDGVVWLNRHNLFSSETTEYVDNINEDGLETDTPPKPKTFNDLYVNTDWGWSWVMDLGTEENSPIGSGFEGGQPDSTRGAENLDNGVPTDEVAVVHDQLESEGLLRWELARIVE